MSALVKIFSMLNDRLYATETRALAAWRIADWLRLAVSALAKLSLSVEMFATEAGRSGAVVAVEAMRFALRFALLVQGGFDVLVHGGEPDALAVRLEQPVEAEEEEGLMQQQQRRHRPIGGDSSGGSAMAEPRSLPLPPVVTVVHGDIPDTSAVRSLWWRGAESGRWLNMPPNHPGAVAETCRRAHFPAVWQLMLSEVRACVGAIGCLQYRFRLFPGLCVVVVVVVVVSAIVVIVVDSR
jgi:hypothetical protein